MNDKVLVVSPVYRFEMGHKRVYHYMEDGAVVPKMDAVRHIRQKACTKVNTHIGKITKQMEVGEFRYLQPRGNGWPEVTVIRVR